MPKICFFMEYTSDKSRIITVDFHRLGVFPVERYVAPFSFKFLKEGFEEEFFGTDIVYFGLLREEDIESKVQKIIESQSYFGNKSLDIREVEVPFVYRVSEEIFLPEKNYKKYAFVKKF